MLDRFCPADADVFSCKFNFLYLFFVDIGVYCGHGIHYDRIQICKCRQSRGPLILARAICRSQMVTAISKFPCEI